MEKALTLWSIEEELVALVNTEEMVEDEEQRLQILDEIKEKTEQALQKRSNIIRLLQAIDVTTLGLKAEEERMAKYRKHLESRKKSIQEYVIRVIDENVEQPKRGPKKLECPIGVMTLAKKPDTVEVESVGDVPWEYQDVTISMRGETFKELLDVLKAANIETLCLRENTTTTPRKRDIKAAIDSGKEVPGADIRIGGYRLAIR